jgi:hypothetical protein
MAFKTQSLTLGAAVATNGTFTVGYPTGFTRADFFRGVQHYIRGLGGRWISPRDFTVAFGASSATFTWLATTTLPAGTALQVELDRAGPETYRATPPVRRALARVIPTYQRLLVLGNPAAGSSTAIAASQSVASGVATVLTASPYTMDQPRNASSRRPAGAWRVIMAMRGPTRAYTAL